MFTILYLCTQCPVAEKWYEVVQTSGRARGQATEFATLDEAGEHATFVAKLRRTICRVIDGQGHVAGQTPDFRRVR